MPPPNAGPAQTHELKLTRIINVPREKLFRCWTEPALLPHWFCPKPWGVARAELDVRGGGNSCIVMRSPDGQEFPNPGVYLEVVRNEKIVFTDAYTRAWEPSAKPFMTGVITFEDLGGGRTRYTARVLHWSAEDLKKHQEMGFEAGWGTATDQLAEFAATL